MKKAAAKHLCLLVATLMALSLFPVSALAISTYRFEVNVNGTIATCTNLQAAVDTVPEGGAGTITIVDANPIDEYPLPSAITVYDGLLIKNRQITLAFGEISLTVRNEDSADDESSMRGMACVVGAESTKEVTNPTSSLTYTGTGTFAVDGSELNAGMGVLAAGPGATATAKGVSSATGQLIGLDVEGFGGGAASAEVGSVTSTASHSYYAALTIFSDNVAGEPDGSSVTATASSITSGAASIGVIADNATVTVNGPITVLPVGETGGVGVRVRNSQVNVTGGISGYETGVEADNSQVRVNGTINATHLGIYALTYHKANGFADVTLNGNITVSPENGTGIAAEGASVVTMTGTVSADVGVRLVSNGAFVLINGSMSTTKNYILFGSEPRAKDDFDAFENGYHKYLRPTEQEDVTGAVWVGLPIVTVPETIYTYSPANVSGAGAALSGGVSGISTVSIQQRGFLLSTAASPTFDTAGVLDVKAGEDFKASTARLTANTLYYVRAYARTNTGAVSVYYGNTVSFTTGAAPSVPNTGDGAGFNPSALTLVFAAFLACAYVAVRRKTRV